MSKDNKAPFKGLSVGQYMKKAHKDITLLKHEDMIVLVGEFCGYAQGPMTDTGCINVCERYSNCDEACRIGDIAKLVEGGQGVTWCDVCGEIIPESSSEDIVRVSALGKRYKTCSEACAETVR
jgi:hypothetical protein